MKLVSIDCNIFDLLSKDQILKEKLITLNESKKLKVVLSPTVFIEICNADEKNGANHKNLIPFHLLIENTSFPPFIPSRVKIGNNLNRFNKLKGDKKAPKRLKDPRIMDTLLENKIEIFVTENKKDFQQHKDIITLLN